MTAIINKSMDRTDLFTDEAEPILAAINQLIRELYSRGLYMTSWYGTLPDTGQEANGSAFEGLAKLLTRTTRAGVGLPNRGEHYQPLPDAADDARIPWYLYWEIVWVLTKGPRLVGPARLLDAGGTSSLFSCYLASLGHEIHSIDLNDDLVFNGNRIARAMGWNMQSYAMNMKSLAFPDEHFDHAYSICVFEHLDYEIKQAALREIARVLKPNGVLSITFDYRNPAPDLAGHGPDTRPSNQLSTRLDIERCFLSTGLFKLVGNQKFYDDETSYLVHPDFNNAPYSFGAIFLGKK